MPDDVHREINRRPVTSVKDFEKAEASVKKGDRVLILINWRRASLYRSATASGSTPSGG